MKESIHILSDGLFSGVCAPRFVQDVMIWVCYLLIAFLCLFIVASDGGFFYIVLVWRQDLV